MCFYPLFFHERQLVITNFLVAEVDLQTQIPDVSWPWTLYRKKSLSFCGFGSFSWSLSTSPTWSSWSWWQSKVKEFASCSFANLQEAKRLVFYSFFARASRLALLSIWFLVSFFCHLSNLSKLPNFVLFVQFCPFDPHLQLCPYCPILSTYTSSILSNFCPQCPFFVHSVHFLSILSNFVDIFQFLYILSKSVQIARAVRLNLSFLFRFIFSLEFPCFRPEETWERLNWIKNWRNLISANSFFSTFWDATLTTPLSGPSWKPSHLNPMKLRLKVLQCKLWVNLPLLNVEDLTYLATPIWLPKLPPRILIPTPPLNPVKKTLAMKKSMRLRRNYDYVITTLWHLVKVWKNILNNDLYLAYEIHTWLRILECTKLVVYSFFAKMTSVTSDAVGGHFRALKLIEGSIFQFFNFPMKPFSVT